MAVEFCPEIFPGTAFVCTLEIGHEGNHKAAGSEGKIHKEWGDSEEVDHSADALYTLYEEERKCLKK